MLLFYLVLEDISKWNIEHLNEVQIFEKQGYGVKLVIPPSSVEKGQEVNAEVNVIALEKSEITLPADVQLVSCFYKIKTTGKFSRLIEVHLQHNVEVTSQEESQHLAFIKAKGQLPYKFELLPTAIDQEFKPNDNSGIVKVSDFGVFSIVYQIINDVACQQSYVFKVFFKKVKSYWKIEVVVTKNLGPFLEVSRWYVELGIMLVLYIRD